MDGPRVLARAERQHARLRRGRALPGPHRRAQVVLGERALQLGPLVQLRAPPASTRTPICATGTPRSTPASHTTTRAATRTADVRRHPRRAHHAPLVLLHRPLAGAGADADLERLDGRPVPGRRGDPVLQPDAHPVPERRHLAVLREPRPPARPEQGGRPRGALGRRARVVRLLREGRRQRAVPRRHRRSPRPARTRPPPAARSRPATGPRSRRARCASTTPTPKTILPTAGSNAIAATFDPITGGGACATNSATDQADTATYRTDPVPAGGYTLMGSPTVVADITSPGSNSQIAARLLDVDTGRQHPDPGRARPVAAGDHLDPGAAGVPAAPERLQVRGRARRRSSSCCRRTRTRRRATATAGPRTASRT